jgi:cytochrome oxidase Cu insertion factor (SCO1/SenC/PrrC family)
MFSRSASFWTGGAAALLLVLSPLPAADKAPEEKTGIKVGGRAPAFTLKDQAGKERTLDEFLKKGKVAVVFYRSAGW